MTDKIPRVKLATKNGFAVCPRCCLPLKQVHLLPDTTANNWEISCRNCKSILYLDVVDGICYSRSGQRVNRQRP